MAIPLSRNRGIIHGFIHSQVLSVDFSIYLARAVACGIFVEGVLEGFVASFVSIDVETANADVSSICQIGVARFENGRYARHDTWLIDPEDDFDAVNVNIHGIDERIVRGAPRFKELFEQIRADIEGQIIAHHTHFDRVSISRASEKSGLLPLDARWLDTAKVARRTWPEVSRSGFGLAALAQRFEIQFKHHDAGEDARTCGLILAEAMACKGMSIDEWLDCVEMPLTPVQSIKRDGVQDGPLDGEVFAFTGALSIARADAANLAHALGAGVTSTVSGKTTVLVVGDQDVSKLAGHRKSSKHRKAEKLIAGGQDLRIIRETDFVSMTSCVAKA